MVSRRFLALAASLVLTLVSSPLDAQDRPYSEGSVWAISMIRATDGMQNDYLQSLATTWRRNQEEAKRQGLILSYRVLRTNSTGPNDWDLLLMVEYKNWAALDGVTAKLDAINLATLGGVDQDRQLMSKRLEVRRIVGTKNAQELIFK